MAVFFTEDTHTETVFVFFDIGKRHAGGAVVRMVYGINQVLVNCQLVHGAADR